MRIEQLFSPFFSVYIYTENKNEEMDAEVKLKMMKMMMMSMMSKQLRSNNKCVVPNQYWYIKSPQENCLSSFVEIFFFLSHGSDKLQGSVKGDKHTETGRVQEQQNNNNKREAMMLMVQKRKKSRIRRRNNIKEDEHLFAP